MSWLGLATPSSSKQPASSQRKTLDDDDEDFNIDYGDIENDAGLLAELEGLKNSMGIQSAVKSQNPRSAASASAPAPTSNSKNMSVTSSSVIASSVNPPNQEIIHVDVDEIVSNLPGLDIGDVDNAVDDVHVEVTDAEMNDPELLRELQAVTGVKVNNTVAVDPVSDDHSQVNVSAKEDAVELKTESQKSGYPTNNTFSSEELPISEKLKSTNPDILLKYIQLEKTHALEFKRSGDKLMALESLKNMKSLTARHDELVKLMDGPIPDEPKASDSSKPVKFDDDNTSSKDTTLQILQVRLSEYKSAALDAKRANDLSKARDLFAVFKAVQEMIDYVNVNGTLPQNASIPSPPPAQIPSSQFKTDKDIDRKENKNAKSPSSSNSNISATTTTTTTTITQPSKSILPNNAPTDPVSVYTHILTTLESQSQLCTSIAAYHFKNNRKDQALHYHKLKKKYAGQISFVASHRLRYPDTPPLFGFSDIEYELEQSFSDIRLDECVIEILRGFDIGGAISGELETYVVFDFGWPSEGSRVGDGKGQSQTCKDSNPEYGFVKKVPIERTRSFQRHLERKRCVFDVFHQAKGWGGLSLFSKAVHVGRGVLKLDNLLNQCEIHQVLDLVDANNPRKLVGGKLEVRIRVRTPLVKADITRKREHWMDVNYDEQVGMQSSAVNAASVNSTPISTATVPTASMNSLVTPVAQEAQKSIDPTQGQTGPIKLSEVPATSKNTLQQVSQASTSQTDTSEPSPKVSSTIKNTSEKSQASSTTAQNNGPTEDIEELEMQFLSPDSIVSNMVLETEHTAISSQIASLQAAKKPIPEDLQDRKSGLEIRMNILVTMVQIGTLTMEAYTNNVKTAIQTTKKQAISFKSLGRMDLAKQALARIKIMTDEVAEVEAAMASGDL